MPFISSLKESFATAPIENREDVVLKLATANTEDANYYQGLVILQKIYNEVMKQEEPAKVRDATVTERALFEEMQNHLKKFDNQNDRYLELNTRFHLLVYPFETLKSTEFIKKELNLDLVTQKQEQQSIEKEENSKNIASTLDPNLISSETVLKEALERSSLYEDVDINPLAFPYLKSALDMDKLSDIDQVVLLKTLFVYPTEKIFGNDILDRLCRLWKLQESQDQDKYESWNLRSIGFNSFTLSQMDYLIKNIPNIILLQEHFVHAYLAKLVPSQYYSKYSLDETLSFWDDDENVLQDYLNRLEDFAQKLPSLYFHLKSAIRFHKLRVDIVRQDFEELRLIEYLTGASNKSSDSSPIPSRLSNAFSFSKSSNDSKINEEAEHVNIRLPLFGDCRIEEQDRLLVVQEYLTGLITQDKFTTSIESLGAHLDYHNVLKPLYAELMLTVSPSPQESWAKVLGSQKYEQLVKKSSVVFTPASLYTSIKRSPSDAIKLFVRTKNISRLSIRVFQINMENYSRLHLNSDEKAITTKNNQIDLDGLCPTWEKDLDFSSEPAIRVKTNEFIFGGDEGFAPDIFNGRGLWVIEFVGGQNQCRAIIQKGYLRHVIQESTAGHIVRVLDESGRILENSKIWCGNQYYQADESNNVLIPYLPSDSQPKTNKMLLMSALDDFCETVSFCQLAEKYQISATFYVNPEMVSFNKKATVVVSPKLTMNGISVPLSLLESTSLVVECSNVDQVKNISTYKHTKKDASTIYFEFIIPDRLVNLNFTLQAKIKTLNDTLQSVQVKHDITYAMPLEITGVPESVHLRKSIDGNYFIHVFGKNGEPKANYEVALKFNHSFNVYNLIYTNLKTNDDGEIALGSLPNIQSVDYSTNPGVYKQWPINNDKQSRMPLAICVSADTPFRIACSTDQSDLLFSLYRIGVRDTIIENVSELLQISEDHVSISGLPEGEYRFNYASTHAGDHIIKCSVIKSQVDINEASANSNKKEIFWSDWVIGSNNYAKQNGSMLQRPLCISGVNVSDNDSVTIQLKNSSPKTFLIVTTSTFVPTRSESLTDFIKNHNTPRPLVYNNGVTETKSLFLDDKQLGEEYQYVLNRARSEKWVGSNLTKPTLLMYPKKNASTTSKSRHLEDERVSASNKKKRSYTGNMESMMKSVRCGFRGSSMTELSEASLAFLDHQSPILILPVSTDGTVTITRQQLGFGGNLIQVVAISGEQAVYRAKVMPSHASNSTLKFQLNDLRQKSNSNKALIRSKVVKKLLPNEKLALNTHEYEIIDSFEKLLDIVKIISPIGNRVSQVFEWSKTWSSLTIDKKLKLHEENVCHEFNFWLKRKDVMFFDQFVRPAIKSKIQKSFMDRYLTDENLSEFSLDIYKYEQLSTAEKALLATTQSTEFLKTVLRSFEETFDDKKLDNRSDAIFDSILAGSALTLPEVTTTSSFMADSPTPLLQSSSTAVYGMASGYSPTSPQYSAQTESFGMFGASAPPPPGGPSGASRMMPQFAMMAHPQQQSPDFIQESTAEENEDEESNEEQLEAAVAEMREKAKQRQKKATYEFTKPTTEWAEAGYYNEDHNIAVNKYWIDFLQHHLNKNSTEHDLFLSESFMYSLSNETEVYFVLSMLDLPFASEANWTKEAITSSSVEEEGDNNSMQLSICASSSHPLMVFYRTLSESSAPFNSNNENNLMLAQELFLYDRNTSIDSDECIKINPSFKHLDTFVQYGNHVIISNVSGKTLSCQVTVQVPTGSIPCGETSYCKSETISIEPYSTWHKVAGTFYFPSEGEFIMVPVTVSSLSGDKLLGKIDSFNFNVINKSSNNVNAADSDDTNQVLSLTSWPTLANTGSSANVISFLENYKKLDRLDLSMISWRMKDGAFARQVFDVLSHQRYFYSPELWKYGVYHQFHDVVRDLLKFDGDHLLANAGLEFESPLIHKKVEDCSKVFDYYPLLNARAHPLKPTSHEILNDQFYQQYDGILTYLSQKTTAPTNNDLVVLTLYLILQDRIGDAQTTFARIQPGVNTIDSQVQVDYLNAYLKTRVPVTDQLDQHLLELETVKQIASKYKDFGILRWRKLFAELYEFVCEIEQGDSDVTGDLTQNSARIQSKPLLEFEINQQTQELVVQYANINSIDVKYYEMNIEVMFSTNPFMNDRTTSVVDNDNFTWIKPSYSSRIELPKKLQVSSTESDNDGDYDMIGVGQVKSVQTINIPFTGGNKNVFVEISSVDTSDSIKRRQAYFSHSLQTHLVESFGIVRVMSGKTKRPLAGAYVKVYVRMKSGKKVQFWKDGYTGLNGVFDYIGVTEGNALMGGDQTNLKALMEGEIEKLSILIISTEEGAVVKEAYPPLTA